MTRHVGLRSRIARLEQKQRHKRPKLPILFAVYPDEGVGDVTGIGAGDDYVPREGSESLGALTSRAWRDLGQPKFMVARYAVLDAPEPAPRPVLASPVPEPSPAPDLGGIGRVATRAELEKWAAIPVPLERLIP